jgi:hypothetical protein
MDPVKMTQTLSLQSAIALIQCAAARFWENHPHVFDINVLHLFSAACADLHCSELKFRLFKIPQKQTCIYPLQYYQWSQHFAY